VSLSRLNSRTQTEPPWKLFVLLKKKGKWECFWLNLATNPCKITLAEVLLSFMNLAEHQLLQTSNMPLTSLSTRQRNRTKSLLKFMQLAQPSSTSKT
jgi:hypothetical protein